MAAAVLVGQGAAAPCSAVQSVGEAAALVVPCFAVAQVAAADLVAQGAAAPCSASQVEVAAAALVAQVVVENAFSGRK